MRGKKAKRLRKAGLKSGPAPRPELNPVQEKIILNRIERAKCKYSKEFHYSPWATKVRERILKNREQDVKVESTTKD